MTTKSLPAVGTIPHLVLNLEDLYDGNLVHYFKALFFKAQNLNKPYHNFRHMLHITWLCYEASQYYYGTISRPKIRALLIGGLGHDADHSGMLGQDDLNIQRSWRFIETNALPEDRPLLPSVKEYMWATEFPHKTPGEQLSLPAQILRDADMSQTLSVAWIQQVIFGLAAEWGKQPIEVLRMQTGFLSSLKFHTSWAQEKFPQSTIDAKIDEVKQLLEILDS